MRGSFANTSSKFLAKIQPRSCFSTAISHHQGRIPDPADHRSLSLGSRLTNIPLEDARGEAMDATTISSRTRASDYLMASPTSNPRSPKERHRQLAQLKRMEADPSRDLQRPSIRNERTLRAHGSRPAGIFSPADTSPPADAHMATGPAIVNSMPVRRARLPP